MCVIPVLSLVSHRHPPQQQQRQFISSRRTPSDSHHHIIIGGGGVFHSTSVTFPCRSPPLPTLAVQSGGLLPALDLFRNKNIFSCLPTNRPTDPPNYPNCSGARCLLCFVVCDLRKVTTKDSIVVHHQRRPWPFVTSYKRWPKRVDGGCRVSVCRANKTHCYE